MEKEGEKPLLQLLSSYAYQLRKGLSSRFRPGEGLIGQCALEKSRIVVSNAPRNYIRISSGLGDGRPRNIVVMPVIFEGEVKAVIELASFNTFTDIHLTFLDQLTEGIGIVLNTISAGTRTEELLKQSQSLTQELQAQQEELREKNTRLEQQTATLKQSEELLREQQDHMRQTNEELQDKARLLQLQKAEVENKNNQIELARGALQEKAEQLALTSKYKSEFLANMSHELRTPLNSLLILSRMLTDNDEGNLSSKQLEYARTIYGAGSDLLSLINDILDMAKVESGTISLDLGDFLFAELRDEVQRTFAQVAQQKGLEFTVDLDPLLPQGVSTDAKRLRQILKNLLSNACKFTERGRVALEIAPVTEGWNLEHTSLNRAGQVIAFKVTDTGIGIPADKLMVIFEPFQQVDGSTARRFGGTGLGLSITRELVRLLGGEIRVESTLGRGSIFTLFLPQSHLEPPGDFGRPTTPPAPVNGGPALGTPPTQSGVPSMIGKGREPVPQASVADDRESIRAGDRTLLIIEDDATFAGIMLNLARDKGFKGLVALDGEAGLALAGRYRPDAITLDIRLPDADGWTVLDRLKHNPETAHIPVHIISVEDEERRGLGLGALACIQKPASREELTTALSRLGEFAVRRVKHLLIVMTDSQARDDIAALIGNGDVEITAVGSGSEAVTALGSRPFDCIALDLALPDRAAFELLRGIQGDDHYKRIPIIIYHDKDLSPEQEAELRSWRESVVLKDVRSPQLLVAETTLFLHRVEANLPEQKRRMISQVHKTDPRLARKKVLIVDDDVRNVLSLTAILERQRMDVIFAENGRDALTLAADTEGIDVVLMDIMMPEMDGYETTRRLRRLERFKDLPIIALTAKAMKGDRDLCIEAGASDYVTKPVDPDQLLSVLRVWLYR